MKAQEELEKILTFDATLKAKEELLERKDSTLWRKYEELDRLASIAEKMTATTEGEVVSRSRNLDPLGAAIAKKDEKEKEIEQVKKEIEQLEEDIAQLKSDHESRVAHYTGIIDNLRNPLFITILYGKYFLGKSLRKIAKETNYSYRNIRYQHTAALKAVDNAKK